MCVSNVTKIQYIFRPLSIQMVYLLCIRLGDRSFLPIRRKNRRLRQTNKRKHETEALN